jgi:hypothetical protein
MVLNNFETTEGPRSYNSTPPVDASAAVCNEKCGIQHWAADTKLTIYGPNNSHQPTPADSTRGIPAEPERSCSRLADLGALIHIHALVDWETIDDDDVVKDEGSQSALINSLDSTFDVRSDGRASSNDVRSDGRASPLFDQSLDDNVFDVRSHSSDSCASVLHIGSDDVFNVRADSGGSASPHTNKSLDVMSDRHRSDSALFTDSLEDDAFDVRSHGAPSPPASPVIDDDQMFDVRSDSRGSPSALFGSSLDDIFDVRSDGRPFAPASPIIDESLDDEMFDIRSNSRGSPSPLFADSLEDSVFDVRSDGRASAASPIIDSLDDNMFDVKSSSRSSASLFADSLEDDVFDVRSDAHASPTSPIIDSLDDNLFDVRSDGRISDIHGEDEDPAEEDE